MPIRSTDQRMFISVPPFLRRTTLSLFRMFLNLAIFRLFTRKFVIRTSLCARQRDHCPANIHVECIPSTLDQETSWVSPDQLGSSVLPTQAHMLFLSCRCDVVHVFR